MRLAFVISSLHAGGAERVCSQLCNYFVSQGIEVSIILKPGNESIYYPLDERIKIKRLEYRRNNGKGSGLTYLIKTFTSALSLRKIIKEYDPDIIISFITNVNAISILAGLMLKKPVIVSERNTYQITNFYWTPIRRYLYKLADKVVLLTRYDKEKYYDKYLNNTTIIQNPVYILNSSAQQKIERKKVILCVGRLSVWYRKGFDRMLSVFKEINAIHPDWHLLIAGDGDTTPLRNQATEAGISSNVKFLGKISDMETIYRQAPVFALSSRNEGLPNALLEAMACGCACVSFDIPTGPSEIIEDGVDGFLVKDNDLNGFKNRIIELIENENLRNEIGREAMEKSKKYNIKTIGSQWMELINSIIKK